MINYHDYIIISTFYYQGSGTQVINYIFFADPMEPTTTEISEMHTTIERIASEFDESCDNTR